LGIIVGELKSIITNEYIKNVKTKNWPRFDKRLWQRDFYERIIRDEKECLRVKEYIRNNPKYIRVVNGREE
jgi:REP element-mobilizing transposase RayT